MVLRSKLFFSLSNMAFSNTIIAVVSEVMSIGMSKHRVKGPEHSGHVIRRPRRADEMSDLQQVQPSERRDVVQWMLRGSAACFF